MLYSERFVATGVRDSWQIYTVPAGRRAIVRSIAGCNIEGSTATVQVSVAGVYVVSRHLDADQAFSLDVRIVAYSGEQISVFLYQGLPSVHVCGYLLLG